MRRLVLSLAAAAVIGTGLAAALPTAAHAQWGSGNYGYNHDGWQERAWREHRWREWAWRHHMWREWREHHGWY